MAGLLIRLVGTVFVLIQAALLIRLLLPFIDTVPKVLRSLVPPLLKITDALIAPFAAVVQPFQLSDVADLPGVGTLLQPYLNRIDPAVVVAMIGWALIGAVVLLVLRFLFRSS